MNKMAACGCVMVAVLSPVASVIVWGLVLLVVLLVAGVALELARRRWLAPREGDESAGSGFSMERLETLRRAGQISDEEFDRLRRQVLGLPAAGNPPPRGSSSPPGGDDGNAVRNA